MDTTDRILELIDKKKIGDYTIEKQIGLSRGTIANWRARKNKISIDALQKIALYFNVSVDYLLGFTDKPAPIIPTAQDTANAIKLQKLFRSIGVSDLELLNMSTEQILFLVEELIADSEKNKK